MTNNPERGLLALSIIVGSLVAATPASANWMWKNSKNLNECLGVAASNMTAGTALVVWGCDSTQNQNWTNINFSSTNDGNYQFYDNAAPVPPNGASMCIALGNNGSISNSTPAVVWNCTVHTDDQAWTPVFVGMNADHKYCYYFQSLKGTEQGKKRVLGVTGGNVSDGIAVILWDYISTAPDQVWCAYPDSP
jgi:hypothetical protein